MEHRNEPPVPGVEPGSLAWRTDALPTRPHLANDEDLVLAKVKAHQVRALAASQAFYHNAPIDSLFETCTLACHNTFSSFYLKNLSESHSSSYRLSPFVAAHSVVR